MDDIHECVVNLDSNLRWFTEKGIPLSAVWASLTGCPWPLTFDQVQRAVPSVKDVWETVRSQLLANQD